MRKTVTLLALCLPLSAAMADDRSCTDAQRQTNLHNAYIMTGLPLDGPIKSVTTTRNNKKESYGSNETTITLSPCGAVTQYEQKMYHLSGPDIYRRSQIQSDPDNPLHLTGTSETRFRDKLMKSQTDITRTTDDKGQISGYTMLDKSGDDGEQEDTAAVRFTWENGRVHSMDEVNTDGEKTESSLYHYDSQGRLVHITRGTSASEIRFTYTDQPWPSVIQVEIYHDNDLFNVLTARCEQWDHHGNCLLQKNYTADYYGYSADDNPEPVLQTIQRYRYEYY